MRKKTWKPKKLLLLPAVSMAAAMILLLNACGSKSQLPDISVLGTAVVVSREDGSGTRAEFENLVQTDGKGTDQVASSTDETLEMVGEDLNAIGYAAYSSAADKSGIKLLSVDGVAPSEDTIKKGKYPLCRNYYLAYSGELNALEKDFLAFVATAGQDIVAKSCIAVKEAGTFLSDQSSGSIRIEGSSSVAPIMEELAGEYKDYNPNAEIEVESTDSGAGLTAAIRGECDFAMSSRNLESYEEELLEKSEIGTDGIIVAVNSGNPVTDLSMKQVKGLYDGSYESWGDME